MWASLWNHRSMNVLEIVVGVLVIFSPLQWRLSMRRIRTRLAQRGGHVDRFDAAMARPAMRVINATLVICGIVLVVAGVTNF
jgi:hypothetical protein